MHKYTAIAGSVKHNQAATTPQHNNTKKMRNLSTLYTDFSTKKKALFFFFFCYTCINKEVTQNEAQKD